MAVAASRLPADSSDGRDAGPEEERSFVELRQRALELRHAARETVSHSRALRLVLEEWKDGKFTSRCAWCSRYRVDGRWIAVRNSAFGHRERTTHTICEDCTDALQAAGLSK